MLNSDIYIVKTACVILHSIQCNNNNDNNNNNNDNCNHKNCKNNSFFFGFLYLTMLFFGFISLFPEKNANQCM